MYLQSDVSSPDPRRKEPTLSIFSRLTQPQPVYNGSCQITLMNFQNVQNVNAVNRVFPINGLLDMDDEKSYTHKFCADGTENEF